MADEIRADYTQLQQVATQFSRQATAINRMQQQMKRSLSALQGNWIGHGSEAFFSEMRDKVLPATQRLADALRAAQKVTLQISQVLRAAEEDAARPFRRGAGLAAPGYASQHWGVDVHEPGTGDWTYGLARQVLTYQGAASPLKADAAAEVMANIIAAADLSVDLEGYARFVPDLVRAKGDWDAARAGGWSQTVDPALGMIPEQYYHYATLGEAKTRLQKAITAKDPVAFGRALHSYQDVFSHTLRGFSAQRDTLESLQARCPTCTPEGLGITEKDLTQRASQIGHDADAWADIFDPAEWNSMAMAEGSQWYILLFLLNYYGVDKDKFLADTGYQPPSQ